MQSISQSIPILIWVYPRKQGWPDLSHSGSNLSYSHSPSHSIHFILDLHSTQTYMNNHFVQPCHKKHFLWFKWALILQDLFPLIQRPVNYLTMCEIWVSSTKIRCVHVYAHKILLWVWFDLLKHKNENLSMSYLIL